MDESNPLAALVAQHQGEVTVLDKHFEKSTGEQLKEPIDEDDDEDAPIGLNFRQPSFSSLHGELIPKGGRSRGIDLDEVTEDPVIVVDAHSDASLGYRQPSDNSLMDYDFRPMTLTIPIEDVPEEVGSDPNIAIAMELRDKNWERWARMGYEPTTNFVETVQNSKSSLGASDEPLKGTEKNVEPKRDTESAPRIVHRRCGSSGMELGEASESLTKMAKALMLPSSQNGDEDDFEEDQEEQINEEEEEEMCEEEDWCLALTGRMARLVKQPCDSPIYRAIATGDVSFIEAGDIDQVREGIQGYLDRCIDQLWIDETAYLGSVLERLAEPNECSVAGPQAEMTEVEVARQRARKSADKYDKMIEREQTKLKAAIETIDSEYRRAAASLDTRFQSEEMAAKYETPSNVLISMRERCKKLLRSNQIDEARRESTKVQTREKKESKEASAQLRDRYFAADSRLKEDFVVRRDLVFRQYNYRIEQLKRDKADAQKKHKARIATSSMSGPPRQPRASLDPRLPIEAPKQLSRAKDSLILETMTKQIARGRPAYDVDVDMTANRSRK